MEFLCSRLINSKQTRSLDLRTRNDSGSNDRVQEGHLGREILEMPLKSVSQVG